MKAIFNRFVKGEFLKFVLVGVISAITEYTLYFIFKSSMNYLSANVVAFGFTNILTFILSRRFVFTSTNGNRAEEAGLFIVCLAGALLVNQAVLWGAVEFASLDHPIAKAIAIGVTIFWNFFTRKHIVFRNRTEVVAEEIVAESKSNAAKDYPVKRF